LLKMSDDLGQALTPEIIFRSAGSTLANDIIHRLSCVGSTPGLKGDKQHKLLSSPAAIGKTFLLLSVILFVILYCKATFRFSPFEVRLKEKAIVYSPSWCFPAFVNFYLYETHKKNKHFYHSVHIDSFLLTFMYFLQFESFGPH